MVRREVNVKLLNSDMMLTTKKYLLTYSILENKMAKEKAPSKGKGGKGKGRC